MLMQSLMQQRFGDDLVVWIAPRSIHGYVFDNVQVLGRLDGLLWRSPPIVRNTVRRVARRLGWRKPQDTPFYLADERYRRPVPLEDLPKFRKVADIVECRDDYTRSQWFDSLRRALDGGGEANHKEIVMRSEAEVHAFFQDYVLPLVDSMERRGYDPEKGRPFGCAMIGPTGELHKANAGDHRFIVARLVGASPVPLRVAAVGQRWARDAGLAEDLEGVPRLIEAVQRVAREHA